jgi:hypothetical protein
VEVERERGGSAIGFNTTNHTVMKRDAVHKMT